MNPDFKTQIKANYDFERHQKFKFEVVDDDGNGEFEMIGTAESTMGSIMGSKAQTWTCDLEGKGKPGSLGKIIVRAEALQSSNIVCHYRIQGVNMPNMNSSCCGLSQEITPIRYEWHRSSVNNLNQFSQVYQSSVINNTQNPHWPPEKRDIGALCAADLDVYFKIVVFSGTQQLGFAKTTMNELKVNQTVNFTGANGRQNGQI